MRKVSISGPYAGAKFYISVHSAKAPDCVIVLNQGAALAISMAVISAVQVYHKIT